MRHAGMMRYPARRRSLRRRRLPSHAAPPPRLGVGSTIGVLTGVLLTLAAVLLVLGRLGLGSPLGWHPAHIAASTGAPPGPGAVDDVPAASASPAHAAPARVVRRSAVGTADASPWRRVLQTLDQSRARAWFRGTPRLLRAVYAPGSPALSLDRGMLAAYRSRRLHVRGVHLDYARVRVTSHASGLVTLRVVDRLHRVSAVTPAGVSLPLPRDRASRHEIVLRRVGDGWRIAAITRV